MRLVVRGTFCLVAVALLAAPAAAADRIRLDGERSTQATFDGHLSGTSGTAPFGIVLVAVPVAPAGCTAPSCERIPLTLSLPRGSTRGTLQSRV